MPRSPLHCRLACRTRVLRVRNLARPHSDSTPPQLCIQGQPSAPHRAACCPDLLRGLVHVIGADGDLPVGAVGRQRARVRGRGQLGLGEGQLPRTCVGQRKGGFAPSWFREAAGHTQGHGGRRNSCGCPRRVSAPADVGIRNRAATLLPTPLCTWSTLAPAFQGATRPSRNPGSCWRRLSLSRGTSPEQQPQTLASLPEGHGRQGLRLEGRVGRASAEAPAGAPAHRRCPWSHRSGRSCRSAPPPCCPGMCE